MEVLLLILLFGIGLLYYGIVTGREQRIKVLQPWTFYKTASTASILGVVLICLAIIGFMHAL